MTDDIPGESEDFEATESMTPLASTDESAKSFHAPSEKLLFGARPATSDRIDAYRVIDKIAEGGMGAVYVAEQQHPIRRKVALKVIKAGQDSSQILARFDAERQALAMMDHPNIAKILDAGQTTEGSPYFVMELVQGIPFNTYCDENRLTIRERLKLFIPVCLAIQHAHQKGIIHRDLKPSNVLVGTYDGVAVPKVIDFGLAKALDHQTKLTDKSVFTEFGMIVGTIQYMSPEQAEMSQFNVDSRTDIYSLGVMLYELLTGSTPVDKATMAENALLKILEMIREQEPPRPSTRLTNSSDSLDSVSVERKIEPSRLQKILRGDLDWIVMKSLDKDRNRRYESASAFADDIHRFLSDDAVVARPPSRTYLAQKFIRKNRRLVAGLSAIAFLLVAGIIGTSYGFIWALNEKTISEGKTKQVTLEKNRADEEKVRALNAESKAKNNERIAKSQSKLALTTLSSVIMDFQQGLKNLPQSSEIRRTLIDTSLKNLELVSSEFLEKAAIDAETAVALLEMGQIIEGFGGERTEPFIETMSSSAQTVNGSGKKNSLELAESYYEKSVAILDELFAQPDSPIALSLLVDAKTRLTSVQIGLGKSQKAEPILLQCKKMIERLDATNHDSDAIASSKAKILENLGLLNMTFSDYTSAESYYSEAHDIRQNDFESSPDSFAARINLANTKMLVSSLQLRNGEVSKAENVILEAIDLLVDSLRRFPGDAQLEKFHAFALQNLSRLQLDTGQVDAGVKSSTRSLEVYKSIAERDLDNLNAQHELADAYESLARAWLANGMPNPAIKVLESKLGICEALVSSDASNLEFARSLAMTHVKFGHAYEDLNNFSASKKHVRQAAKLQTKLWESDPDNLQFLRDIAVSYDALGRLNYETDELAQAKADYKKGLSISKQLFEKDPDNLQRMIDLRRCYERMGDVLLSMDDIQASESYYYQSLSAQDKLAKKLPNNLTVQLELGIAHYKIGGFLFDTDQFTKAIPEFENAVSIVTAVSSTKGSDPYSRLVLADIYRLTGESHFFLKNYVQAEKEYLSGISVLEKLIADGAYLEQAKSDRDTLSERLSEVQLTIRSTGKIDELMQQPESDLPRLLAHRAVHYSSREIGKFGKAAEAARLLLDSKTGNSDQFYDAACVFSLCLASTYANDNAESEEVTETRRRWTDSAILALNLAFQQGFSDFDWIEEDSDLDAIRQLDEFKSVVKKAKAKFDK